MTPTGCICGGTDFCAACESRKRARVVEQHERNVLRVAKYLRRNGVALPAELRDALDYLAIAERRSKGGPR